MTNERGVTDLVEQMHRKHLGAVKAVKLNSQRTEVLLFPGTLGRGGALCVIGLYFINSLLGSA